MLGSTKIVVFWKQNSIDVAFDYFMRPEFGTLRACIYTNETELCRFRQIVVNTVLATDCEDHDLMSFRKIRFDKCFGGTLDGKVATIGTPTSSKEDLDRKATLALEMILSTADIFHATQNWHLYQKWNERHFQEKYAAYQGGRLIQDPSVFWYKRELLFFDDHVIPAAKQLAECGLF